MPTKSIRLSIEEAASLRQYVELTGEVEAVALKRAAMRGLREFRLEQGVLAYLNGRDSGRAAAIAGLPRARFLEVLMERGVSVLDGSSTVAEEVEDLAEALGDEKLGRAVRAIRTPPA
jgi:predicted HTH domain antitoxin